MRLFSVNRNGVNHGIYARSQAQAEGIADYLESLPGPCEANQIWLREIEEQQAGSQVKKEEQLGLSLDSLF